MKTLISAIAITLLGLTTTAKAQKTYCNPLPMPIGEGGYAGGDPGGDPGGA